jgi:flagellar motility protein MotE (MotC chaperone)
LRIFVKKKSVRFELTKEFITELRLKIVAEDRLWIQEQVLELHYAEIAEILDRLTNDEAKFIYFMVDEDTQADILMELEEEVRDRFLASLSSKEMADQLENLDSDDAADILGELPDEKIQEVISHMEDDEAAEDIVEPLSSCASKQLTLKKYITYLLSTTMTTFWVFSHSNVYFLLAPGPKSKAFTKVKKSSLSKPVTLPNWFQKSWKNTTSYRFQ